MTPYSEVIELTRTRFPQFGDAPLALEPLEKGGSDRKFYRVKSPVPPALIYVQYGQQREENRHYVEIGAFLERNGVRVPKMYHHELDAGRIWMEDLGELDLWSFRQEPWSVRKPLYEATLREVLTLHRVRSGIETEALGLQPAFDERLYVWEQDYFLQNCLGRHFGIEQERLGAIRETMGRLASQLAELPRVLVHRDFQSQNIVIRDGAPCLIDFQGMRFGLPQYDLASILLDPYVELSASERGELLDFYCAELTARGGQPGADFVQVYALCAAQRLMQALGAYGFLGHEKGRAEFLAHIPIALPRLQQVLGGIPELGALREILESLPETHSVALH